MKHQIFKEIVGQSKAIEILKNTSTAAHTKSTSQEMAHSWLFTGPPGSGRSNLAAAFAASLVCSNNGCGNCTDCKTAIAGTHPDVEIFTTDGISIKVDDIRELISRSAWGASVAPWRVIIIEDCDRMTESAANALLKALEEPALQSVWLLCAPTSEDVLPTIRSRCRVLTLTTPSTSEVSTYLTEVLPINMEEAKLAASIAQGHIGRAKRYASDNELLGLRKKVLNLFFSINSEASAISVASQIQEIATMRAEVVNQERNEKEEEILRSTIQGPSRGFLSGGSKALKDLEKSQKSRLTRSIRDELDTYLLWLQSVVRDAIAPATISEKISINPDLDSQLENLRTTFTPFELEELSRRISEYRESLDSNAAQLLSLESFCLQF